ncbi:MAG: phosphonoacetaldehyde hydrolase, partial [Serratia liquefaciens]|nr:phosphonoacetaldehyde hydrolase [Serratia liquefaciens]
EVNKRRALATDKLYSAGAHYVIDTLAQLPDVIAEINQRLVAGERP